MHSIFLFAFSADDSLQYLERRVVLRPQIFCGSGYNLSTPELAHQVALAGIRMCLDAMLPGHMESKALKLWLISSIPG